MKRYSGKKISTAVFISGKGSNLKNLIKFSKKKNSPINIDLVFSNNKNAIGLKYAKGGKIDTLCYGNKKFSTLEKKLLRVLREREIKFICLAGFMKILTNYFIKEFKGKIINIHPSLLPKYKGLDTHRRVLENNELYTGCTVHFVSHKLDSGKIILQKKIKIYKKDNIKKLNKRVLLEEHKIYPKAILKIFS
jgi:phosphoribosylglycinamide formyltransferase-1